MFIKLEIYLSYYEFDNNVYLIILLTTTQKAN